MAHASKLLIVLVTAPNRQVARSLAKAALESRLIACANILPGIESHYWWQGRVTSGKELLLILKTRPACLKRLEKLILHKHPYDTPEFIALSIAEGSKAYLKWLTDELA
jgi:periplasmic divalent cation tolerance protein